MFNVAVVNIKDILKYLVTITITLCLVMSVTRFFSKTDENKKMGFEQKISEIVHNIFSICLNETIPAMKEINYELNNSDEDKIDEQTMLGSLLKVELAMFSETKKESVEVSEKPIEEIETNKENFITEEPEPNESTIEYIQENVKTEVVTQNPLSDNYTVECNGVKIKNETGYELTQEMLMRRIEVNNSNIVIFHTHTCESYTASEQYSYIPTGNYRTTDNNFSVVRVGSELSKYLRQYGYNTIHNTTYHDYPAYSGSYNRSLNTVESILKTQSSDIIIDIHRDAIGSNPNYAPTVKIGEDYAAQLMFVIGTNGGGLWHSNWTENLAFAIEVQEKANELYPGLFKPMILRKSRYNQHLGKAACIIEVGATGNTLEQSINSMKYLANVFNEVLK